MTDKLLVERKLLEQLHPYAYGPERVELQQEVKALLAAPRQPEGEVLEVVAYAVEDDDILGVCLVFKEDSEILAGTELCRLSDAQRVIAELREECKIQRNSLAGARNQLRANRLETERLAVDWQAAVAERDTLRQQRDKLAELMQEVMDYACRERVPSFMIDRMDAALADIELNL